LLISLMLVLTACGGTEDSGGSDDGGATDSGGSTDSGSTDSGDADDAGGSSTDGSIWVLLPDSASSARWETDDRRFFEAAFDAAGVSYNIVNAEGDAATQQTQAEQAITAGAKVIMLVNLDSGSGAAIIAAARDADVKIIDYDRLTIEGPGADVYVSFDNVQVGATMGNVLEPLIDAQADPKVAYLNGGPTDNNATLFRQGYDSVAAPKFDDGSWSFVVEQAVPGWDNQEALVIFEQMLTAADGDISAVFAANDGLANAAITAYKNAGVSPADAGIPISGQDATVGGIQNILAGDQAMTVYKSIKAEADAAAAAAIALLNGDSLDSLTGGATLNNGTNDVPFIALDPVGVTKDNIADTVIADGFRTWEEICVGDFAQYCPEDQGGTGALAGAGEGVEGSIWVLLPDSASSARWETDDRRFFEGAFEAAGVEYNIVNAEGDAATQQTQAEQAITAGASVIMLVNLDSGSGAAIIAAARDAGVKVVDYDRLTIEGPGADVYVSFDNVTVGSTMGHVLEPLIDAQADTKVAYLNGGPTDNNATLFRQGYDSVAAPNFDDGSWTFVTEQAVPGWDNQEALVIFEQMLTAADGDISAVFAANDGLANAAITAYKNSGVSPADAGIPISGQDATVGGIQNILAGDQAMTVYKPIKAEAETAALAAIALLKGEDLTALTGGLTLNNGTNDVPFVALEPIGVTIGNIATTVIADGFRTWEELCVGDFEQYCTNDVRSGNVMMDDMDAGTSAVDYMAMMPDASGAEGSVWVLLPDSASSARWETDDRRFFEAAFDAAGVGYNIVNAEGDAATQQAQAEQAIVSGAAVILMVNLDSGSGAAIIASARDAGVAVIDYDRLTIEGPGADLYVSFDNEQVGATMADVLVPLIDAQDDPQVVMLNGGPTDNNATLFRNGYFGASEAFYDSGDWTLVADQAVPGWDNQEALVIFEQILTAADNNVTAVYAANDGLGGAVIQAFQNAGIDPGDAGIPISGQDATVGGIQHVLAGDQAMTVYKPIKAEAEAAAVAAVMLLLGEDLSTLTGGATINNGTNDLPFIALTPIGVTADNVAETVIADGFRTWDEICVGEFEQYCPADR
ncbi:MAG: substrate-binding domain-containing protein, partial [Chloroflexota bacterium]